MDKKTWTYIDVWSKRIRAINYLGGKCKKCENDNIFHLVFHHRNSKDKEFSFGGYASSRWSTLKKEIKKCELLCDNCHREHHYLENNSTDIRRRSKRIYLEYKGNRCKKCKYDTCDASLTFHHINKESKSFDISDNLPRINTINELKIYIKKELDKCNILCVNCHREEHTDIDRFNKNKSEIYFKVNNYKEVQSKIPRKDVYKLYKEGIKQVDIANIFNASKGTISNILKEYK